MSRGNPDNLRRAAARKSAAALTRADQGLREMLRRGQPVTFRALAQAAGVSLDFLYRNTELRGRVEQLRAQQQNQPPAPTQPADPDQPSSVIRTLTAQLAELKRRHRNELLAMQQALAASHGENLELRRRLGRRHGQTEDVEPLILPAARPRPLTDASASVPPAQTHHQDR